MHILIDKILSETGGLKMNNKRGLIKRLAAIMVTMLMAFAAIPFAAPAEAETLTGYNPDAAITFAKNNTYNYKDCVKFARACAEKGGVPRQSAVKSYSAKEYMDYLTSCGYAVKNELEIHPEDDRYVRISGSKKICNLIYEENTGKLAPGDLLIYKCKKCGKYFHVALVSGIHDTIDYGNNDTGVHAWMLEAQSANGKLIKGQPFYCYQHSSHGRSNVTVYAMHFTSAYSGFEACNTKIGALTAKKISKKTVRLKWAPVEGAVAYKIYSRGYTGGPVLYMKQVTGTNVKVAVPRNKSGKLYNYKNVRYTVAPVFKQEVTFESVTKTYKVVGKKRTLVKVK